MKIKFLSLIILVNFAQNSLQAECDKSEVRKIDATVARLLTIGNSGRRFPESKGDELKDYCNESKSLINQIENFKNKCLKDLPKQVTSVIVYSVKNNIDKFCKKDSKRLTELLQVTPCVNKATMEFGKCYTRYIDGVMGAQQAPEKRKIPLICCEYFRIFSCSEERMRKVRGCSEKQIDVGLDWIRSLFGNVIDLICSDYTEGSDKCSKIEPTPKKKKSQRRPKSFLMPLVDILSSFKEL